MNHKKLHTQLLTKTTVHWRNYMWMVEGPYNLGSASHRSQRLKEDGWITHLEHNLLDGQYYILKRK